MKAEDEKRLPQPNNSGENEGFHHDEKEQEPGTPIGKEGEGGFEDLGLPKPNLHFNNCKVKFKVIEIKGNISIYADGKRSSAEWTEEEYDAYFTEFCENDKYKLTMMDTLREHITDNAALKSFLNFLGRCTNTFTLSLKIDKLIGKEYLKRASATRKDFADSVVAFAPKLDKGANARAIRAAIYRAPDEI